MDFVRRLEPQSLPGSPVELITHFRDLLVADSLERRALGEVLPQEPVGVLVGPTLPWMMRECETEPHAEPARDLGVGRELLSAVGGYRLRRLPGEGPAMTLFASRDFLDSALPPASSLLFPSTGVTRRALRPHRRLGRIRVPGAARAEAPHAHLRLGRGTRGHLGGVSLYGLLPGHARACALRRALAHRLA